MYTHTHTHTCCCLPHVYISRVHTSMFTTYVSMFTRYMYTHTLVYIYGTHNIHAHALQQTATHTATHAATHVYVAHNMHAHTSKRIHAHACISRAAASTMCALSLSHTQTPTHTNTYTQIRTSKISATHWHPLQHTSTHFYGIGRAVGGLCLHTQLYVCVHRYICIHKKRLHINIYIYTPGS